MDSTAPRNRLLNAIPQAALARLEPDMERVTIRLGASIYEGGVELTHAYFPLDSIVSLLGVLESGSTAEIAVVGNDGVVGVSIFMGGASTPSRAIVQSEGTALRLKSDSLMREFRRGEEVQHVLLRYTQALITQMTQTAVCNRHHSLDQQLCRWLLLSIDLLPSNELRMTQELIASMLGVRRESVTEAAGKLQAAGMIKYSRGHITVLNRAALESRVCECYAVVRRESMRLHAL